MIVSAHLDTVFPQSYRFDCCSEHLGQIHGPGLGDNSLGVAALFGLLLDAALCAGSSRYVAGIYGLWQIHVRKGWGSAGMKAVVERFGANVQAYLVLEGLALGHVYHRVWESSATVYRTNPGRSLMVRLWPAFRNP